ncbi:MAG: 16S rRNA (guanine(966)-N(2))-methyltransferase RsmD [Arcobacteraceae bacterium]
MKNKVISKIVGGKYKNRVLELPSLEVTRSSKSILKESFFNVLQFDIMDTLFIEAFGGSGGIGLEALSRGAKHSYFCELNKNSFKILQNNCKAIEPESCTTLFGDTFEKIPNLLKQLEDQKSVQDDEIILYLDPPFDIREGMTDVYEKTFDIVREISNKNVVLVTFEHMTGLDMPETLGQFKKYKTKKFGKSALTYYRV